MLLLPPPPSGRRRPRQRRRRGQALWLLCAAGLLSFCGCVAEGAVHAVFFRDPACQQPLGRVSFPADGSCRCADCPRRPRALPGLDAPPSRGITAAPEAGAQASRTATVRPPADLEEAPVDEFADNSSRNVSTNATNVTDTPAPPPARNVTITATVTSTATVTLPTASAAPTPTPTPFAAHPANLTTATLTLTGTGTAWATATVTETVQATETVSGTETLTLPTEQLPRPTRTATATAALAGGPPAAEGPSRELPLPRGGDLLQPVRYAGSGALCTPCDFPSYVPVHGMAAPSIAVAHARCTGSRRVRMRLSGSVDGCAAPGTDALAGVEDLQAEPFTCTRISAALALDFPREDPPALYAVFSGGSCPPPDDDGLTAAQGGILAALALLTVVLVVFIAAVVLMQRRLRTLSGLPRAIDAAAQEERDLALKVDEIRRRGETVDERVSAQRREIETVVGGTVGAQGAVSAAPPSGLPLREEFDQLAQQMAQVEADLGLQKRLMRDAML